MSDAKKTPEPMTRYQKWHLRLIAIGGSAAIGSLIFLWFQVHNVSEQSKIQTFQALAQTFTRIDLVFVERPHLRKYFYDGVDIKPDSADYATALGVAELLLDTFDGFFQRDGMNGPGFAGSDDVRKTTAHFISDTFSRSPVLCKRLADAKSWYSMQLNEFANAYCRKR